MYNNANVDPSEVAKFEQLAATWWDPEGHSGPLHRMNPLRLAYIERHADGLFGKKVVDVGCGGGLLSEAMARVGAKVTGLDMGEEPLEVARLHALESGVDVDYLQATAEQHAADYAGQYQVVTCMEMIEHVPDPGSVIRACADLVAPGGHLYLSTINKTPLAYLTTIVGAEQLLKVLPKGTHDYNKYLRPSQLVAWCEQAGLKVRHADGVRYNPLTQTFSMTQSMAVNYMIHAYKPEA
ncbi:bifunctional 2-polyprenyl-6-hydroxyphenol methylase/3-demethylubiquinol 3-O-methyltransferase UbiG [Ferrimonas balearica]|uniref:bifunctional 2-polyprenyl-6-hydroxyphenol methylase/3-demethylubiquinol 3-O-methyltransferase UbiG n=1 Tax=Ferrimonas balearica TaxID=44012 RepID=UPI001C590808|nr:bifunctional 2-polyprenyl-6-hydroxyphenol methylase/3-demethylubiquinol 3-O-methyltransferase UbiG [Ferrimonas balearica]MBW3163352.1 bifunctional 2-polyprenyl-6-hydroxyphenol methylase/3-demethylubiquinol 3-O-methyltransferase UbiG [Ferrimonas balearica]MBY6223301.1 bifunctional 2-polyprenyl-6-hydroxyphenol methylase/3-demethylubiquinol 3-O-methyltransferase UbiG [Ferrimonas balearica]